MKYLDPEIQSEILRSLKVVEKAQELSFLLDDLTAATYKSSEDLGQHINIVSTAIPVFKLIVSGKDIEALGVDAATPVPQPDLIREVAAEIAELIRSCDRIKVEMSYEPSAEFVSGIYGIFESLGYKRILLDFSIASEAGTGARFYHNGNFIDVSMFDLIKEKMKGLNFGI